MAVLRESPWYAQLLEEDLEKGLEQGLERGLEQGRKIGRDEGAANMLLLVLQHRFGPVQPALEERIHGLNTQQLTRVVDAASMDAFTKSFESAVYAPQIG